MTLLFKVLDPGGACRNGGHGKWHLPKGNRPGKWMPRVAEPEACVCGYHVCTALQLLTGRWLGPEVWIVEVRGKSDLSSSDKSCHEQARIVGPTYWNERAARLFAADCAERTLPLYEKQLPQDMRPRQAIETARRFANGEATQNDLAAAWAAAGAAAWAAAWAAARDAARAAAWAAARAAAWAAAGAAAWDAARAAAWDAAGAAAGDAARAAERAAAWDAAGDAAWDAAGAAAGDAARAAEQKWQAKRLRSYLTGPLGKKCVKAVRR
jgi:hypothetical protein